jgi:hypothetical protein
MADVDAFGLRLGSKVSKAASLAARPMGCTMREIVEATGDTGTKYNIFVHLKAKGHIVRREGRRIFLKHKDGVSTKGDADDPEESPSEPMVWTPSPERCLQKALRGSLDKLEPGLVAIDGGREEGFRDITAKDQAGNTVVIELKPMVKSANRHSLSLAGRSTRKAWWRSGGSFSPLASTSSTLDLSLETPISTLSNSSRCDRGTALSALASVEHVVRDLSKRLPHGRRAQEEKRAVRGVAIPATILK